MTALTRLTLTDFRNYESLVLKLDGRPVCLYGANGAGKTTLLSAILSKAGHLHEGQPAYMSPIRGEIVVGATTAPVGKRSLDTNAASVTNMNGASGRQAASSDCSG